MVPYVSVGVLVLVLGFTGFFATVSRVSLLILHGLHAYVQPDDTAGDDSPDRESSINNGGGEALDNKSLKRRSVGKKKKNESGNVFDETAGAQILRMRLTDGQLESRNYFPEYDEAVIHFLLGLIGCVAREILEFLSNSSWAVRRGWADALAPDDRITFTVSIFVVYKLVRILSRASYDAQLGRSERVTRWLAIGLGLLVAFGVLFFIPTSVMDFGIDGAVVDARASISAYLRKSGVEVAEDVGILTMAVKLLLAVVASLCSGLLVGPALRQAKFFWAGTDQPVWNISVINKSRPVRVILNLATILPLLVALLWVQPIAEIFVRHGDESASVQGFGSHGLASLSLSRTGVVKDDDGLGKEPRVAASGSSEALGKILDVDTGEDGESKVLSKIFVSREYDWTENFGISECTLGSLKLWGLFVAGMLQLLLARINLQTYCDGAVIIWYENLHRSKVQNRDVLKARLFLNNFFVCRIAIQLLVPGALVVVMMGLARTNDNHQEITRHLFPPSFVRAVTHFCCWWLVGISALQTWMTLALLRLGVFTTVVL